MTDGPERHPVADAAEVAIAGALVRLLLLSGHARIRTRISVPDTAVVSTSGALIDVARDRALTLQTTAARGEERGPKAAYYADGATRVPLDTEDGTYWADIGGLSLPDFGYGMVLGISGITSGPHGVTVVDPARALAATSPPLLEALQRTLTDVGWQDHCYHAPARAYLHCDGSGVDLEVRLEAGRGPRTTPLQYDVRLRLAPEAVFPPWPEPDARYEPDHYVRAVAEG